MDKNQTGLYLITDHSGSGKGEGQIERILEWRAELASLAKKNKAIHIDASFSPDEVVNSILERI